MGRHNRLTLPPEVSSRLTSLAVDAGTPGDTMVPGGNGAPMNTKPKMALRSNCGLPGNSLSTKPDSE